MPIAAAQPAQNTLLKIATAGSPSVYNVIANVGDLNGPTMNGEVVDVTSHSTGSPWRQRIVTLLNPGEISIPLFFIPSSPGTNTPNTPFGHNASTGLLSIFTSRALESYSVTFPDAAATTWYFSGYITNFSQTAPVAGVLTAQVTFTMTGAPILA